MVSLVDRGGFVEKEGQPESHEHLKRGTAPLKCPDCKEAQETLCTLQGSSLDTQTTASVCHRGVRQVHMQGNERFRFG